VLRRTAGVDDAQQPKQPVYADERRPQYNSCIAAASGVSCTAGSLVLVLGPAAGVSESKAVACKVVFQLRKVAVCEEDAVHVEVAARFHTVLG
jgi:hypothetical protein